MSHLEAFQDSVLFTSAAPLSIVTGFLQSWRFKTVTIVIADPGSNFGEYSAICDAANAHLHSTCATVADNITLQRRYTTCEPKILSPLQNSNAAENTKLHRLSVAVTIIKSTNSSVVCSGNTSGSRAHS